MVCSQTLIMRQRQADAFNDIHRIEGLLSNTIPHLQREYLSHTRNKLRKSLGPQAVDGASQELA